MKASRAYEDTPVGKLVVRFLRYFRAERGATLRTIEGYELALRIMCNGIGDAAPGKVTLDDLRDIVYAWAELSPGTRAARISAMRTFWLWCEDESQVEASPAQRLRRPKLAKKQAPLLPLGIDEPLLESASSAGDRIALLLLLDYGLRCSELASVQAGSFDIGRRRVTVLGKGQKERALPLRGRILDELQRYFGAPLPHLERPPSGDDYLLHPPRQRRGKKLAPRPKEPLSRYGVHCWWYQRLQAAGIVAAGTTRGVNMHRARHSFAVEFRRATDIGLASLILGHSSPAVTAAAYGHFDFSDLESGMDTFEDRARSTT